MSRIGNVTGDNGLSFPSEPPKPAQSGLSEKVKDLNEQHEIISGTMGKKECSLSGHEVEQLGDKARLGLKVAV